MCERAATVVVNAAHSPTESVLQFCSFRSYQVHSHPLVTRWEVQQRTVSLPTPSYPPMRPYRGSSDSEQAAPRRDANPFDARPRFLLVLPLSAARLFAAANGHACTIQKKLNNLTTYPFLSYPRTSTSFQDTHALTDSRLMVWHSQTAHRFPLIPRPHQSTWATRLSRRADWVTPWV